MERDANDAPSLDEGIAILDALRQEVTRLHAQWKLYSQLFTNEARLALLDHAAASAFGLLQEALARSIELGIARLLDRVENGKQHNLSLRRLPDLLLQRGSSELASEATDRLAALTELCGVIVDRRNKKLAHTDLHVSLEGVGLDPPTWRVVDEAVSTIGKLMKRVEAALCGRSVATVYEMVLLHGDGDDLIAVLEEAQAHRDDQRAKRR